MDSSLIPTQEEVDLVAAYVETAKELRAEPFFDPYENPSYSTQGDKLIVMHLGDRFHFRSALIPFRRIWRKGEDTYFGDILLLLERHSAEQQFASYIRTAHEKLESDPAHSPHVPIPGKQLVDGWLYSVFVHTNLNRKIKNPDTDFNRKTFESYLAQCGHAWLEYAFRESVRRAGWLYLQILDVWAAPQLAKWEAVYSLKPSFTPISAFGSSPREKAPDGTLVVRKSSSFYGVDETLIQRFFRLLKRFRVLEGTFGHLKMEPEQLLKAFVGSRSVKQILEDNGWELHLAELYRPADEHASVHHYFDPSSKQMGSMWFERDQVAIVSRNTLRVWSREFSSLKSLL